MIIQKQDESYTLLISESDSDKQTLQNIYNFLKSEKPDAKYNFKVQKGWESPYNYFTEVKKIKETGQSVMRIMNGHLELLTNYNLNIPQELSEFTEDEIDRGLADIIKMMPFEPYDYQLKCAKDNLLTPKQISLAATSAGKSCIIFMIMYFLYKKGKKGYLIVPNVNLLTQLYQDFSDYFNGDFSKERDEFLQCIDKQGGGYVSEFNNFLVISTWQSLMNRRDVLDRSDFILCDECLSPDTMIATDKGYVEIRNVEIGDKVLTINETTGDYEFKPVVKVHKNLMMSSKEKMYELRMEDNSIIHITGNHKVNTERGWVRVDELNLDDNIKGLCDYNNAKHEIMSNIYPVIKHYNTVPPKIKENIFELVKLYNPQLLGNFLNTRNRLSIKTHLLYAFLNGISDISDIHLHLICKNTLTRIIENITILDFFKKCKSYVGSSTKHNRYLPLVYKYGMDVKFPRLVHYSTEKIHKIVTRTTTEMKICIVCGKPFRLRNTQNNNSSYKSCSTECQNNALSIRMKLDNPCNKMTDLQKKERAKKSSNSMKELIGTGQFTPEITNSWCKSMCIIDDKKFRSTWEAFFYLKMNASRHLEYEKIRIPYFDNEQNKTRTYITDFVDFENKILYEIKPGSLIDCDNVKQKEKFAENWCLENGFEYMFITDGWFYENYDEYLICQSVQDEETKLKMLRNLKQFKEIL